MFIFDLDEDDESVFLRPTASVGRCVVYRTEPDGTEFRCGGSTGVNSVLMFNVCDLCYDAIKED